MITNTTSAHASVVDTSAVGDQSPISDARLEKMDSAKIAEMNGVHSIQASPMLLRTKFSAVRTIFSAIACRLEMLLTFIPCVRKMHTSVSTSITPHVTTSDAVILMPPRIGISK